MNSPLESPELTEPGDMELTSSTGCIICGQQHDRSYLKTESPVRRPKAHWTRRVLVVALPILWFVVCVQIVVSAYLRAEHRSWESAALNNLLIIQEAEESFRQASGRYGTFEELIEARELTEDWAGQLKGNYRFSMKISGDLIHLLALPENRDSSSFLLTMNAREPGYSAVYGGDKKGNPATRNDELIGEGRTR